MTSIVGQSRIILPQLNQCRQIITFPYFFIKLVLFEINGQYNQQKMKKEEKWKNAKWTFRSGILQESELFKSIENWVDNLDIDMFVHQQYFKYFPRFVLELSKQFTANTVKYAILKRFPSLFVNDTTMSVLALSQRIKQHYTDINIKIMMKMDAYFYFLCIYFTKIITNYLNTMFHDIEVDMGLESQFYVILVFVMIGLQVSFKSYQISLRKIISEKGYKNEGKFVTISKMESIESKPSYKKLLREKFKFCVERKCTNMSSRNQISPFDNFKQCLKENLAVQVLPKLVKKKMKAFEFDEEVSKLQADKQRKEKGQIFEKKITVTPKPAQQFINSNQTSTSFEMFFRKNHQKCSFVHRNVKISHRPQLISNFKANEQEKLFKISTQAPDSRRSIIEDDSFKSWQNVIQHIKHNTLPTNKLISISQQYLKQAEESGKTFEQACFTKATATPELFERKVLFEDERCSANDFVSSPDRNFGSYWIENRSLKQSTRQICGQKEKPKRSSKLRRELQGFDHSCHKRRQQAHYSMFNIHSTLTSFHK